MKKDKVELFVPGRLCLLGEHSDWAGKYRTTNSKINKGYAIVTGIEEGIYATAEPSDKLIINDVRQKKSFTCSMDVKKLKAEAAKGEYWSYCAGVAAVIKELYANVAGIEITINKTTIPIKKILIKTLMKKLLIII